MLPGGDRLVVEEGDLTCARVDAIVNAANSSLLGGGGVDGAIHRAAGPGLLEACKALREVKPGVRCPTGEARITPGFALAAAWVIHTVGPVYRNAEESQETRRKKNRRQDSLSFPGFLASLAASPPMTP